MPRLVGQWNGVDVTYLDAASYIAVGPKSAFYDYQVYSADMLDNPYIVGVGNPFVCISEATMLRGPLKVRPNITATEYAAVSSSTTPLFYGSYDLVIYQRVPHSLPTKRGRAIYRGTLDGSTSLYPTFISQGRKRIKISFFNNASAAMTFYVKGWLSELNTSFIVADGVIPADGTLIIDSENWDTIPDGLTVTGSFASNVSYFVEAYD